jgi:hypothetical protein
MHLSKEKNLFVNVINGKSIKCRIYRDRVVENWKGTHPLFPGIGRIVRARRILAERLRRSLKSNECAHHKDQDILNDIKTNIILKLRNQHTREHKLGHKPSIETRLKIAKTSLGRIDSPETRQKKILNLKRINEQNLGRKLSEETKQKMREGHRNRKPISYETRLKMSKAQQVRRKLEKYVCV